MRCNPVRWNKPLAIGAMGAALALVGCSSTSNDGASGGGAAPAAQGGSATVSAKQVDGVGMTLVSAAGDTLYFADQESDGTIRCVDACLKFWFPLTVGAGQMPTAGSGVAGTLSTVKRPDGAMQVTYDGKPLYSFAEDGGPGGSKGNGFTDGFNGVTFSWHAAALSGSAAPAPSTTGNGYDYGNGY